MSSATDPNQTMGATNSCPICNAAPRWTDRPDTPGLWLRRQWWKDTGKPYDGDQLREFVLTAVGLMLRTHEGQFYELSLFEHEASVSRSLWFGPIPEPDRDAIEEKQS